MPDRNDFQLGDRVTTDLPWSRFGDLHTVFRRNAKSLTVMTPNGGTATIPYEHARLHTRVLAPSDAAAVERTNRPNRSES